jgi:hypothetical protein
MEGTPVSHPKFMVLRGLLSALVLMGILAAPATAQKKLFKDLPVNHPKQCPYCGGDPKRMEAAGIISHGGFEFAKGTTATVDQDFEGFDIFWIETEHFKLGLELKPYKIPQKEKDKLEAELAELRKVMPEIPGKVRVLDPWLRSHIFAARVQSLYKDLVSLLGVEDAPFPKTAVTTFDPAKPYWGLGPHLGMKKQHELLVIRNMNNCSGWLRSTFGLLTKSAQRWHIIDRGVLIVITHLEQGKLRVDEALHGHVVFNLVHNLLNGYKYYSYDKPLWLMEGLAHWFERRITTKYNTFDGGEGASASITRKENWEPPTRQLVSSGDSSSMGKLMRINGFGEFELPEHFTTWSMVDYLQKRDPRLIGDLLGEVSGLLNDEFMPNGGRVNDVTREFFKERLSMTMVGFERAWQAWVLETYGTK